MQPQSPQPPRQKMSGCSWLIVGIGAVMIFGWLSDAGGDDPPAPTPTRAASSRTGATDAQREQEIRAYLFDGFGRPGYKTSWYDLITAVSVQGSRLIINTSILADAEGKRLGAPICGVARGLMYDRTKTHLGIQSYAVRGQNAAVVCSG